MKSFLVFCLLFGGCTMVYAQTRPMTSLEGAGRQPKPKIQPFWFIMLKTGAVTDLDSTSTANAFQGHMDNMKKLYELGVLKAAGPFGKNEYTWRGLFVFDCKTKEEAQQYLATDPAVKAGLLAADIVQWYTEPSGSFTPGIPEKKQD
ncbi:MAG: hypothetical protein JWQ27_1874 [Ferruginibacter sp.]|nr:hypothetical protein [Ferruginibacter sp.]